MDFTKAYNRAEWIEFLQTRFLPDDFKLFEEENIKTEHSFKYINNVNLLGESESLGLKVYEIHHTSAYDPRISLTRESFKLMNSYGEGKSLAIFTSPNDEQYRLSLITIDLSIEEDKIKKIFSNPRRFSFLLGSDAKLGTVYDKLLEAKTVSETKRINDFNDLKERFSVESVSKQFFKEYKELYEKTVNVFRAIQNFNIVASKNTELEYDDFLDIFSRKLLGQIVFIYFLQRKRWLGGNPSLSEWDDGKTDFLRWAFKHCERNDLNFFEKFLEKLFYCGFNEKGDSFEFDGMYIKVPFLNGGLFERFYSSDESLILTPTNNLFSNKEGTGILDVFEKYNFTIDENTFFEQDVAVDPEMLGKVFENLLPENLRKGQGAFYTPREIVSYMTRESLINFLIEKIERGEGDKKTDQTIRRLFEYKDYYISKRESEDYGKEFEKQFFEVVDIVEDVNEALKDIKIVDPAVGSGAFPMGILLEIVSLRYYIEKEFLDSMNVTNYNLKKAIIQNSIYGVDIDPGAVEIAKLRFWLSLVVDAEKPEPLPNLDYKIMQGNSLVEKFAGIDIKDFNRKGTVEFEGFNKEHTLASKLHDVLTKYYSITDNNEREKLREEIESYIINIYHAKVEKEKEEYYFSYNEMMKKANSIPNNEQRKIYIESEEKRLKKLYDIDFTTQDKVLHDFTKKDKIRPFFPWHLYFADVFDGGGFDIVIGNPPYVCTKGTTSTDKQNLLEEFDFADDLYSHFYFKGLSILTPESGFLSYISSKTFWTIQTKKNLRELFLQHIIYEMYDTASPFEAAMVDTCIMSVKNTTKDDNYYFCLKDGKKNLLNPRTYQPNVILYKNAVHSVFFIPTEMNLNIYEKFNSIVKDLMNTWWNKIKTSRDISKNEHKLNIYRNSLKPGDVTLLGLITEGGVGLQTGNNGRYIGALKGTKYADRTFETRPKKLFEAIEKYKIEQYKFIKTRTQSKEYLAALNEYEIRTLFDELKEKYGRDIFGQGYLYRIVSKVEIADAESLTEDEKKNGINNSVSFVPYDKGDKDGNRWYLRTPYYIDWKKENVEILKTDPKARWQGYDFFFRNGFCWSDIHTILIKTRLKTNGVHDVKSMSLFSVDESHFSEKYLIAILNSTFISEYDFNFVNSTQTFQINDARQIPIIVPTEKQKQEFEILFDRAYELKVQEFDKKISKTEAELKLNEIQEELDQMVLRLYGFE